MIHASEPTIKCIAGDIRADNACPRYRRVDITREVVDAPDRLDLSVGTAHADLDAIMQFAVALGE